MPPGPVRVGTNSDASRGNTDSARVTGNPQGPQHVFWCFTYNNYDPESIVTIERLLQHECKWYVFQEETGANGTPHLQGIIRLNNKQRLTAMKRLINPSVHWEPTKSVKGSVAYCQKRETRTGKIYAHGIDIEPEPEVDSPYGWQQNIMDIIKTKPDKRKIHWFWEETGNVGKTTLAKYLVVKHDALMLSGKAADMYHMLSKYPNKRRLIIVDVPRCNVGYINYGAIEQIKNGLVFSGKYEGCQLVFDCPHVVVFANEPPHLEMMSNDRWHVVNIAELCSQDRATD